MPNPPTEPPRLDVTGGTLLRDIHVCPKPKVHGDRSERQTTPARWRCDCGALWELVDKNVDHSPVLARHVYVREWVRIEPSRPLLVQVWDVLRDVWEGVKG